MRMFLASCILVVILAGCAARFSGLPAGAPERSMIIRWQRLVDASDRTCPRCASTEQEVHKAYDHLRASLAPVGVQVTLQTERIDEATFLRAPLESNRVWINGRPLEDWLGGQTASSACSGCCEGADCRTVSVGGATYEAIPAALIVRAGILAAGEALRGGTTAPVSAPPAQDLGIHP